MNKFVNRSITALATLVLMISLLSLQVMAATGTLNGLSIATTGSTGSISTGTNSVTLTVKKGWSLAGGSSEDTFTFTNPSTNTKDLQVSFEYSFSGTSKTISGVTEDTGSKCSVTLSPGGSFSVYVKATASILNSAESTFSITNLTVTEVVDSAEVTVNFDSTLGSVTADGNTVEASDVLNVSNTGTTFVATPSSDASFVAWVDANSKIVSREKTYVCKPTESTVTLKAVFASTTPWFYVNNSNYLVEGWDTAMAYGGTVALANNATLTDAHTVPSGVTLLIPFDSGNTLITSDMGDHVDTNYSSPPAPVLYRQLTMASGANITVNGALCVGSRALNLMRGQVGPYGAIVMDEGSNITIKSGANLYAYGYIFYGNGTGGTVGVESGGTVYESGFGMDYPGNVSNTDEIVKAGVFPLRNITIRNVEVPMTLSSGATEKVFYCVYGTSVGGNLPGYIAFVGNTTGSTLCLNSGATMTKSYADGRQRMVLNGSVSFNSLDITMKYLVFDYSANTSDTSGFPIGSNYDVEIASGTLTMNENLVCYEGSTLTIAETAIMNTNDKNIYLLDADDDPGALWVDGESTSVLNASVDVHGNSYGRVETDAVLKVNGTLNVSSGLYTSANKASITSTGNGKVVFDGASIVDTTVAIRYGRGYINEGNVGYKSLNVTSAYLLNSDGTYRATAQDTYTYSNGVWNCTNHSYDSTVTDATCTTDGKTTYTCAVCGHSYEEAIPATGHSYESVVTAPTCTEKGYTTYTCSVCGDNYTDNEVAATGHTEVIDAAVAATCTTAGKTEGKHCSECGEILTAQTEVAATGHTEVELPAVAPTCTATGLKEGKKCKICNTVTVTQEIVAALGHTEETVPAVEPTCTTTGLTEGKKCSVCGTPTVAQEVVSANGHNEVTDNAVAATCKTTGLTEGKHCSVCNEVLVAQTEIAKTDHAADDLVKLEAVAATCTTNGLTEGQKCSRCGTTTIAQETVPALGHTEEEIPAVAPTCTNPGATAGVKCSVCGTTLTAPEAVAALGHTEEDVIGYAATCTEDGLTDGKKCSVCSTDTVPQTVIPALGHQWVNGQCTRDGCGATCDHPSVDENGACTICGCQHQYDAVVTAPNCTDQGYTTYTCSLCRHSYKDTYVDALGHSWTDATCTEAKTCITCGATEGEANGHNHVASVTAPTCTENGYTTYTCSCGDSYTADEVDATGHTEGTPVEENRKDASCAATGSYDTVVYCTVCGTELSRVTTELPQSAHSYGDWTVKTPATCTENGVSARTCTGCGNEETQPIASSGHSYGEWSVSKKATCTEQGEEQRDCANCDDYETQPIAAAGHTEEELPAVAATCTESGLTAGVKCSVCGDVLTEQQTVEALGHTYVDGACSVCGDEEPAELFEIDFVSMVLQNSLTMRFAFPANSTEDWTGAYAVATKTYADGSSNVTQTVKYEDWSTANINGIKHYHFPFSQIAGKEMTDKIYVTIYNAEGKAISTEYTDTVRDYAMRTLANPNSNAEVCTMIVDMLNYGAAAQNTFGYATDNLANSELTETQKTYATPSMRECTDTRVKGNNYNGSRLMLESSINLQMAFANLTEDMYATIEFIDHYDKAQTYTVSPRKMDVSGMIVISVEQIVVADARQDVTVTVYNADGTEYGSATDSVSSYVARMAAGGDPLYELIMKFSDSAYAYLH